MTYSDLEEIATERARFIADANGLPREVEECIRNVIINVAAGYHASAEENDLGLEEE